MKLPLNCGNGDGCPVKHMEESVKENKKKRTLTGVVVSSKMDKTVTVEIERTYQHPTFGKIIRSSSKVYAHDEENACQVGDKVRIEGVRPLSKLKRWRVIGTFN